MGLKRFFNFLSLNKQSQRFVKSSNQGTIEAEEIFLDAEAVRSLEEKGKLEKPIQARNFFIFFAFIIVCLLVLFLRAGYLQIVKGDYYYNLSQGNRLKIYYTPAPRGIIYDRAMKPLVHNVPSFNLVVNLNDFFDNSVAIRQEILGKIAEVITQKGQSTNDNLDWSQLKQARQALLDNLTKKIEEAYGQVSQLILMRDIERTVALVLETLSVDWPGMRIEKNAQRQYLSGPIFAHLLGYTGQVSQTDLDERGSYLMTDQIGKTGLEYQYDALLRGQAGQEQIEVDSLGKTRKVLASKSSQPGNGLILFINRDLQEKLYQSLEKMTIRLTKSGQRTSRAAAVALDPDNGGVLALVSLPSYDNNLFAQGISQADLDRLENDPDRPFLNRAVAGQYPSGSTIKPLIAAAALEEAVIQPYRQLICPGLISVANQYNPQIIYTFPDWEAHGPIDMVKAIAQSCNVYFYTIGGGYGAIEGLGIERIKKYLHKFGLGQLSGIDLPNEEDGLIPDPQWKEKNKPDEQWYLGDTYHVSIGQGDLLVTPLQMATAIAAVANGGTLYQPQIVDKIINPQKEVVQDIEKVVLRDKFVAPNNLKIVQKGMRQAVLTGSAKALSSLEVSAAGKTGTAQFDNSGKTHAWFVGYAPYENPQIVLAILIEEGGEGHTAAVPVAKEVLEWYFSQ